MTWEIKTTDTESRMVKALQLYQSLLHFHENDKEKSAYIDADLARIADLVMTGSFTRQFAISNGDTIDASFDGIGDVSVRFL